MDIPETKFAELMERLAALEDAIRLDAIPARGRVAQAHRALAESFHRLELVSLATLPKKLESILADLAGRLSKQVSLELSGFHFEVESEVRNLIQDILLHAIRNSMDHGIELPQERSKKGKSPRGSLKIEIAPIGASLRLRIEDDGQGPDLNRIREIIVEKRWVDSAEAAKLSTAQLCAFLFRTGFSTKSEATEVSGRGVGLSSLQRWMSDRNGSVQMIPLPKHGSRLELLFPVRKLGALAVFGKSRGLNFWKVVRPEDELPSLEPTFCKFQPLDAAWLESGSPELQAWLKTSTGGALAAPVPAEIALASTEPEFGLLLMTAPVN